MISTTRARQKKSKLNRITLIAVTLFEISKRTKQEIHKKNIPNRSKEKLYKERKKKRKTGKIGLS